MQEVFCISWTIYDEVQTTHNWLIQSVFCSVTTLCIFNSWVIWTNWVTWQMGDALHESFSRWVWHQVPDLLGSLEPSPVVAPLAPPKAPAPAAVEDLCFASWVTSCCCKKQLPFPPGAMDCGFRQHCQGTRTILHGVVHVHQLLSWIEAAAGLRVLSVARSG